MASAQAPYQLWGQAEAMLNAPGCSVDGDRQCEAKARRAGRRAGRGAEAEGEVGGWGKRLQSRDGKVYKAARQKLGGQAAAVTTALTPRSLLELEPQQLPDPLYLILRQPPHFNW